MTPKSNSSQKQNVHAAIHPKQVLRDLIDLLEPLIESQDERRSIESMATLSLPAPHMTNVREAADLLYSSKMIAEGDFKSLLKVFERRDEEPSRSNFSPVAYPVPYAMKRLVRKGKQFGDDPHLAVKLLCKFVSNFDDSGQFTGIMFHKHVIAYRDVACLYWDSFAIPEKFNGVLILPFEARLRDFVDESLEKAVARKTDRVKLRQTSQLLGGQLTLGGSSPREIKRNRAHDKLIVGVTPSGSLSSAKPGSTYFLSARIHEPCPDDDHSGMDIDFPGESTLRDKCIILRQARDGFARRNVRAAMDMSGCSRVTYTDFLAYAMDQDETRSFALIWLSGVPAVDIRRPMTMKLNARQRPKSDEILIDDSVSIIEYRVLRRRRKDDDKAWEACGLMSLPIPQLVVDGLVTVVKTNDRENCIGEAEQLAKKFGRTNAGTTPTTRRLRSSARMHFAPIGFTELQFGALSGLVPPSVRALSHYYHETVGGMQVRFRKAYQTAANQWGIELPALPRQTKRPTGRRNHLLCPPCEPLSTVRKMLNAVGSAYGTDAWKISAVRCQADLQTLIRASNRHSLALYILQELAAGLRPTGNVAQFASAASVAGSLTADKGSRAFSERSFSPLPDFHARLLDVAKKNRIALQRGLDCLGVVLDDQEPRSELACWHTLVWEERRLVRERLTGQMYRMSLLDVPNIIDLNRENNWLRKTIAQRIGGEVPQWQADEFFGHRRCGREPTGHWSTASIALMRDLENLLERWLAPLVPEALYRVLDV